MRVIKNPVLVGKRDGKRSLRRPARRCGDNINTDLQENDGGWAWTGLISLRIEQVTDFCEHGNEYSVSIEVRNLLNS